MPFRSRSIAAFLGVAAAGTAAAQVKYPAPPAQYHVYLRYSIRADRDERIRQYRDMTARLDKLGFVADPREDADLDVFDPTAERLAGTISSANVGKILTDPRIRTTLLIPAGVVLPEDIAKPVQVRIILQSGLEPNEEQRRFHRQVVAQLDRLGFRENVGYDHHDYSWVRGSLPAAKVPLLLKDLRDLPAGWFLADTPRDQLDLPLRSVQPVRTVEVLPDVEGLTPQLQVQSVVGKLTPELRAALGDPAAQGKSVRVEAVLDGPLGDGVSAFRGRLTNTLSGSMLEGVVGGVVSLRLPTPADVARLAQFPDVVAIRLPRPADAANSRTSGVGNALTPSQVLSSTRVADLHALGYRGAGVRVVVVAAEFPGLSGVIGKDLPRSTQLLDLTAELSPTVEAAPADAGAGNGTATALAAHAAAPEAMLTLVRVDPAAFHQLMTVARGVAGIPGASVAIQSLGIELVRESELLDRRRENVTEEYRQAFADLSGSEQELEELEHERDALKKKVDEKADPDDQRRLKAIEIEIAGLQPAKRRREARAAREKLQADESLFRAKSQRLTVLHAGLIGLKGASVVINTLVWEAGYPADGLSTLSQFLDEQFATKPTRTALTADRRRPAPVWVQAGSDAVGSVWAGPFLDYDRNGAMEFTIAGKKPPAGLWSNELNFLGLVGPDGRLTPEVPTGTRLRFTIQWREPLPLDPRQPAPVFTPELRLVRQIDPSGTKAASDELVEIVRSAGLPVRVQTDPSSAVYEQTLEAQLPVAGRYALRIEGRTFVEGGLPVLNRAVEVQPRLFVQTFGPQPAGRVVFDSYAPKASGVGVPGDSPAALTVEFGKGDVPGGLTGAGPGVTLRVKPDLIAPGTITVSGSGVTGSAVAAGYAGGVAGSLASAGVRVTNLTRTIGLQPGSPLVLPKEWLQSLEARPGAR